MRLRLGGRHAWLVMTLGVGLLGACASILDLQDRPIRPHSDASADTDGDVPDAHVPTYCDTLSPPADFCDDFEEDKISSKWVGPRNGFPNPFVGGVGKVYIDQDDGGTLSRALFSQIQTKIGTSAQAILATTLIPQRHGRILRGVHIKVQVRPTSLVFDTEAGAVIREMSVLAFGYFNILGDGAVDNLGVAVLFRDDGSSKLTVSLQQSALGGGAADSRLTLFDAYSDQRESFFNNPLPLDLYLATPDLLNELGVPCPITDPDASAPVDPGDMRVAVQFGSLGSKCGALQNGLRTKGWMNDGMALILGASISDYGSTAVRSDNVSVTMYE